MNYAPYRRYLGATLGVILVLILALLWHERASLVAPVLSEREMLEGLWHNYKQEFIDESGRAIDFEREGITTSEGQSYTMLRAVWIDDREAFDRAWSWTKINLIGEESNLPSWRYGERADGTYGIDDVPGSENSAADADVDMALALLLAYDRWQDESYANDARQLINAIWEEDVVLIAGRPYLAANNVEKTSSAPTVLLNPSYFAPYAFRIFAQVDPEHDWLGLVDTSYEVLAQSRTLPLGEDAIGRLPPDWIFIDEESGALSIPREEQLTVNYGYDAMRVPWRLALDWQWFGEPRAEKELRAIHEHLGFEWSDKKILHSVYSHSGRIIESTESPAVYGGAIGAFMVGDEEQAEELYERELLARYNPDTYTWREPLSYYASNWAWFGIALHTGFLENYTTM
jgi:endoglucanase